MSESLNGIADASTPTGSPNPVVNEDHGPCLYSEDQVRFLRHIGHLFEDALYTEQTKHFMQELFVLWFQDLPEAPEHVEQRKNGITPHFAPISSGNADAAMTSTAGVTCSAASAM
ncbi:hypothetical protein EDD85DRAFT_791964 [Armillaria nabsnona]|nr:hypothetical protein EDD85DRAFT_791964 [Armillaria nabsnona]